jgi:prefoldin subunit 4
LQEIRADLKQLKEDCDVLDDATSEIMLVTDGKFSVLMGEAFVECSEEFATEYCEKKQEVSHFLLPNTN